MIIEGQIHGGLTEGSAVAMGQEMPLMTTWATSKRAHVDGLLPADSGGKCQTTRLTLLSHQARTTRLGLRALAKAHMSVACLASQMRCRMHSVRLATVIPICPMIIGAFGRQPTILVCTTKVLMRAALRGPHRLGGHR